MIRMGWAEALYEGNINEWWQVFHASKGHRDEILGKVLATGTDVFYPTGEARRIFEPLWWRAGRYVELYVQTAAEPVTLDKLSFLETRYPLTPNAKFGASDTRFDQAWPLMVRALQMCSHETYMDCPYYLPRKAIEMFFNSRFPQGLTQARYPCRATQFIPPFSLWWCGMVHDYALWRGDRAFVVVSNQATRKSLFQAGERSTNFSVWLGEHFPCIWLWYIIVL